MLSIRWCNPHCGSEVREYLEIFSGRWIGRKGQIEWPAKSPDITPVDFYGIT